MSPLLAPCLTSDFYYLFDIQDVSVPSCFVCSVESSFLFRDNLNMTVSVDPGRFCYELNWTFTIKGRTVWGSRVFSKNR